MDQQQQTPAQQILCGRCLKHPRRAIELLCPYCMTQYRKEAIPALRTGQKITILDWAEQGLVQTNVELKAKLAQKQNELDAVSNQTWTAARVTVSELLEGQQLRPVEYQQMLADTRAGIWQRAGGNRLFAQVKDLERSLGPQIAALEALLGMIQTKRAEQVIGAVAEPNGNTAIKRA